MVQDFKKFLYHEVTIVLLKELGYHLLFKSIIAVYDLKTSIASE